MYERREELCTLLKRMGLEFEDYEGTIRFLDDEMLCFLQFDDFQQAVSLLVFLPISPVPDKRAQDILALLCKLNEQLCQGCYFSSPDGSLMFRISQAVGFWDFDEALFRPMLETARLCRTVATQAFQNVLNADKIPE